MEILKFNVGDKLQMKKKHPCGSFTFSVLRIGSDIRILCDGCNRDITLPRIIIEKNTKKVIPNIKEGEM